MTSIGLILGCGAVESLPLPNDVPKPPTPSPSTSVLNCADFSLAWSTPTAGGLYQDQRLSLHGALLARSDQQRTEIFRVRDGAHLTPYQSLAERNLSEDWALSAEVEPDRLTIRETSTGEVQMEFPIDRAGFEIQHSTPVWLHGDRAIAWAECGWRPRSEERLVRLSVASLQEGIIETVDIPSVVQFGARCQNALVVASGDDVIIAGLFEDQIDRVDVERMVHVQSRLLSFSEPVQPIGGEQGLEPHRLRGNIITAAASPSGSELAITGVDGRLQRIDAVSFETRDTAPSLVVGVAAANGDTFLPSFESPVAFSLDSKVMAYIDDQASVVLVGLESDETRVLEAPLPPSEDTMWGAFSNAPMSVHLSGPSVLVGYAGGTAKWDCGEAQPERGQLDSVMLSGPDALELGRPIEFTVDYPPQQGPVISKLRIGDQPGGSASLSRRVTLHPSQAGTFALEVIVDDGIREGRDQREVTVR